MSPGFRLACYVALLVAMTLFAALSIVYLQTVGVMQQRLVHAITHESTQLEARFQNGNGLDAVAAAMQDMLADGRSTDDELMALIDPGGRMRAGNLDLLPERLAPGPTQRQVVRNGRTVSGHLLVRALPDGSLLVVGRDLRDQEAIETLVLQASMAAMVVATLLLVGGTFVFREMLDRSVGAIRATATRIAAGNLQERIALSGQEDEFELLNHDLNHMLDRIQSLMDGVRHVSDTMAHNLRTPLTRSLLRLRHAQMQRPTLSTSPTPPSLAAQPSLQETMDATAQDLQELATMCDKLLQIAEAEAGTRRMPFAALPLGALAADVCEMYEAVADAQGAHLQHLPGDDPAVLGDADLLASALANLLDNALKYAGEGAVVSVETLHTAQHAVLTVQDNGPGVDPAHWDRLGTRFHRLARAVPGHGLGLASVRAIVQLHGGTMAFGDARRGLRVQLTLPLAPPRPH